MRISARAKQETRARILAVAEELFRQHGFAGTATRDLAAGAGIAAGTLFNYFPSKEALATSLLAAALERGRADWRERRRGDEHLREDLFAHVAAGLRALAPYRAFAGEVLETALSPFSRSSVAEEGELLRADHLETVDRILRGHGVDPAGSVVAAQLYWTLYLGVLAFWTKDESPNLEDTLVLLDTSVELFVAAVATKTAAEETDGT